MAPIALGAQIAKIETILQPELDSHQSLGDIAGDKSLTPHRRLMVKKDTVASVHPVCLSIIDRDPVGVEFGHRVKRTEIKGVASFCGVS